MSEYNRSPIPLRPIIRAVGVLVLAVSALSLTSCAKRVNAVGPGGAGAFTSYPAVAGAGNLAMKSNALKQSLMHIGPNNTCLEYLNGGHAQLRVVPETSNASIFGYSDPDWNLVDLNSGFQQTTATIDYLGWDGKDYTAKIKVSSHWPFSNSGQQAKFYWEGGDLTTSTMGFVGINNQHLIATISVGSPWYYNCWHAPILFDVEPAP